jgi:hypothetical protein
MMGGDDTEYKFAATGNTFSFTSEDWDFETDSMIDVVTSGTYYYNSTEKTVRLVPTVLRGKTMAQFYAGFDPDDYWGPTLTSDADKKASEANSYFTDDELIYDLATLTLSRSGWGDEFSATTFSVKK